MRASSRRPPPFRGHGHRSALKEALRAIRSDPGDELHLDQRLGEGQANRRNSLSCCNASSGVWSPRVWAGKLKPPEESPVQAARVSDRRVRSAGRPRGEAAGPFSIAGFKDRIWCARRMADSANHVSRYVPEDHRFGHLAMPSGLEYTGFADDHRPRWQTVVGHPWKRPRSVVPEHHRRHLATPGHHPGRRRGRRAGPRLPQRQALRDVPPLAPARGAELAEARSTAPLQLANELPAAALTRTLGIDITVAVQWQRAGAGDGAAYTAEVSGRTSTKEDSR